MMRALLFTWAIVQAAAPPQLAREMLHPHGSAVLQVSTPAFTEGQPIPAPYGQEGENFSPALKWTGAPPETRSFVVLVEDPDAKEPKPFLHWALFNLPADVNSVVESVPGTPQLPALKLARQGRNSKGTIGYVGPRPPSGDPAHHYHFQVFALDSALSVDPGAERAALLSAMTNHVLASGEIIGTFKRP